MPLTIEAQPTSGTPGTSTTVTAVTDLNLSPAEEINISIGGEIIRSCKTTTCAVSVTPGKARTVYEAGVGAVGTPPFTTQALVSAKTSVERCVAVTGSQ
jgi:hypothetical protein